MRKISLCLTPIMMPSLVLIRVIQVTKCTSLKINEHYDFITNEFGIYPQSFDDGKGGGFTERTPEMNEHNEKVTQLFKDLGEVYSYSKQWLEKCK